MIQIINKQVSSTEDKIVHRKGTDCYFRRGIALKGDTAEDFEEVEEIPAYTKEQYDAKVAELVREKYSADEEFALQRKVLSLILYPDTIDSMENDDPTPLLNEFNDYNTYVNSCKERAKDKGLYGVRMELP